MSAIEVDQFVSRPADQVWQALTDPDLLARWLMPRTVTWRLVPEGAGTRFLITHDGFDETDPTQRAAMKILGGGWQGHLVRRLLSVLGGDASGR